MTLVSQLLRNCTSVVTIAAFTSFARTELRKENRSSGTWIVTTWAGRRSGWRSRPSTYSRLCSSEIHQRSEIQDADDASSAISSNERLLNKTAIRASSQSGSATDHFQHYVMLARRDTQRLHMYLVRVGLLQRTRRRRGVAENREGRRRATHVRFRRGDRRRGRADLLNVRVNNHR